jgi:DNA-binding NarL/FixJ family response regulator
VNPRCLIVDDNAGFLEAARSLLVRQGLAVVGVAATLSDGLRRVGELRPEVVLVDIELGADSGFDLARRIGELPGTTVVLISTHASDDFAELIGESPVAGFIPKAELSANAVRNLLGHASANGDGGGDGATQS